MIEATRPNKASDHVRSIQELDELIDNHVPKGPNYIWATERSKRALVKLGVHPKRILPLHTFPNMPEDGSVDGE